MDDAFATKGDLSDQSDDSSDGEDAEFSFDTVAQKVVSTIQSQGLASSSSSRSLKELGLDVGLGPDKLYLTNTNTKSQRVFDTSALPGVSTLQPGDYQIGAGVGAPALSTRTQGRQVRGAAVRPVDDKYLLVKEKKALSEDRLDKWFGMRKRKLTPEMEKQLTVLKLRGSFDPKRFYKANDSKALPTHFTIATEVGGGKVRAGLEAAPEVKWNSGSSFMDSILRDTASQEWTYKKHDEVGARGQASYNSGHGKPGAKGRKNLKSTKRGGSWKKTKKG